MGIARPFRHASRDNAMSDSWEVRVVVLATVVAAIFLKLIYDRVDAMLKEIKGLRWRIEKAEERQMQHSEDLHAIRSYTRRGAEGLWDKAAQADKKYD